MHFLLVDTGWEMPWVSLLSDDGIVFDAISSGEEESGEFLKNTIQNLLKRYDQSIVESLVLGVSCGPGRFSALRCGLAFCQGLGAVLNVPVFGWRATEVMYIPGCMEKFIAVVSGSGNKICGVVKQAYSEGFIEDLEPEHTMDLKEFPNFCLMHDCLRIIVSDSRLGDKLKETLTGSSYEIGLSDRLQSRVCQVFVKRKQIFDCPEIDYGCSYSFLEEFKK